jgi:hypothetical protein
VKPNLRREEESSNLEEVGVVWLMSWMISSKVEGGSAGVGMGLEGCGSVGGGGSVGVSSVGLGAANESVDRKGVRRHLIIGISANGDDLTKNVSSLVGAGPAFLIFLEC